MNMFKFRITIIVITLLSWASYGAPLFVQPPTLTSNGTGGYWVNFQVSEATDVEVAIVDTATGTVIRHLAAGLLGATAPAPLAINALTQQLAWDGKDDLSRTVSNVAGCKARVRAGMSLGLDTIVGQNDYVFYRSLQGLVADSTGAFYAFGPFPWLAHHGTSGMTLRKYSQGGVYEKTLWPVAAGFTTAQLSLFSPLSLPGGQYILKTEAMDAPQLGNSPLTYENSFLCSKLVDGKIMVITAATSGSSTTDPSLRYTLINPDGSPSANGMLIRTPTPALPATSANGKFAGPTYLTLSPDGTYFLLSGCYLADSNGVNCFPSDTGFWRDGQVFKVIRSSGLATSLISIPSASMPKTESARRTLIGPTPSGDLTWMAAIHGTAFDDSGRIFICDRVRNEVGVYNTSGTKLGALAVSNPDQVAINKKTNAVYVLTRQFTYSWNNNYPPVTGTGTVRLWKFTNWQAASGNSFSLAKSAGNATQAKAAVVQDMEKAPGFTYGRLNMTVDVSGAAAIVWVNGGGGANFCADSSIPNIRGYRDDGTTFTMVRDFRPLTRKVCTGFDRIAVDQKTDKVYVNNSWNEAYKIENWSQPVFSRCSTSAGQPLPATDLAVSPDGFLYVHENLYDGPVTRYTQGHLHAAANFGARGTNVAISNVHLGFGGGTQDRGIAVTRDGKIYSIVGGYVADGAIQKYDTTGALLKNNVVGLGLPAGTIRADLAGNIYVGAQMRPAEQVIPASYTTYKPWLYSTGVVVKFNPDTGGAFGNVAASDISTRTVAKALKVYKTPISPFGGTFPSSAYVPSARWGCVCRTPRFDVDGYGRIFFPHAVIGRVAMADNAGNEILAFGDYGNADSRGPGSLVAGPAVPLIWPVGVAASDNYVYVTDLVNARLVRMKMNFILDNLQIEGRNAALPRPIALSLRSYPEPFHSTSRIQVGLPAAGSVQLDVVDMQGRLICRLFNGNKAAGVHSFVWNATGQGVRTVAPGMYFYRLIAGKKTLVSRTLLMR